MRDIELTHLDRVFWPEAGLTKGDLVEYYRAVAPVVLPHLRDRPFTIRRHYTVPRGPFVWEKDAPAELPEWFRVSPQPAKSRGGAPVRYAVVQDLPSLLWLVEYGAIDLHVWPSRVDRPDRPDWVLFDLDPARVPFAHVVETALLLREALAAFELDAVPMTTGGAGMHVRVPIARRHTHAEAREFARTVAGALVRAARALVTGERSPERRTGVFVDTKMNGHGQQVVAPYSVRPFPGAPVATPLTWDELDDRLDPAAFTPAAVRARVAQRGDLAESLVRGKRRSLRLTMQGRQPSDP